MKLATSINPNGNIELQIDCLHSWYEGGFDIISYNSPKELEDDSMHSNFRFFVDFRQAGKLYNDRYPCVSEFFDYDIYGIINSDIRLHTSLNDVRQFLDKHLDNSVIFGHRLDIDEHNAESKFSSGFDYFFFEPTVVPPMPYCIGLPWWDYAVPLHFITRTNKQLKLVDQYPVSHRKHTSNYSAQEFIKMGLKFRDEFFPSTPFFEVNERALARIKWAAKPVRIN